MEKDAYLIMAHNNWEVLYNTLRLLDAAYNDFYIHIDKKVSNEIKENVKKNIKSIIHKSNVEFVVSLNGTWGGYSLIEIELELLKCCCAKKYRYIHLLSGACFPIKSSRYIYDFFKNKTKQYITLELEKEGKESYRDRFEYYYFFQDRLSRGRKSALFYINYKLAGLQKRLRLKRKCYMPVYHGSQWFSITDEAARFAVSQEDMIRSVFKYGCFVDELFIQTVLMNSRFNESVINNNYRLIDWKRGAPYVWNESDITELIQSDALFARKFDEKESKKLMENLIEHNCGMIM